MHRVSCLIWLSLVPHCLWSASRALCAQGNRKYIKCLYVYNKIDVCSMEEVVQIARCDPQIATILFLCSSVWQPMLVACKQPQHACWSLPMAILRTDWCCHT